jgi:SAM-dependent methyltransferase
MAQVIAQHGDWTAHNVHLGHGIFTCGGDAPYEKLLRILQTAVDVCERPLSELRVLDLACLEGGFAVEFARHGAEVLGIEGREANLAKARFAKEVLQLDRLTLELGDVRDLSLSRHGVFDVVICAGILYHLDAPDVFQFVERIADVCRRAAIIDTSFALHPKIAFEYKSRSYWGNAFPEHEGSVTESDRAANLWGSLDNAQSVWLTKSSLLNLLKDVGFTAPLANWEEQPRLKYDAMQRPTYRLEKRLTHMIPVSWRRMAKSVLRRHGSAPWEWPNPWKKSGQGAQDGADDARK